MKHIKSFNESTEHEANLLSDVLLMEFDNKNRSISDLGQSGLPFLVLQRRYVSEDVGKNDIAFCIGSNTQPKLPDSDNNYEIVISFMSSERYGIELILGNFYRRISRFGWSKVSESTCNINGYTVDRSNCNKFYNTRLFKKIYIKRANIRNKK